ncbi:MAG: type IV secretion protein Rhs [Niabella sp.]|nr:type IV secretion protein Rhs [Niabella sp.]
MAQLTQPMFSINGEPLLQFTSFSLRQSIFEHHQFTLTVPAQSIDGKAGMFTRSGDWIGGSFGARIDGVGLSGTMLFNGIITGVETARFTGHQGDVIITGNSPTIVLDSGPHCKSWEGKTIKNIAADTLKFFPRNLLEPRVQPLYGETLAYTVQYKETAWQFLKRLTGSFGEWLFWDGRSLVIGPPRDDRKIALVYGQHLSRFNVALQARPVQLQLMAWDYLNSQVYSSKPEEVPQKAGLNGWGEQVYQAAQSVYGTQPKQWNSRFITNKKQQDDLVNLHSAVESSKLVQFNGQSGHPGVAIGRRIEVCGNNVFTLGNEGYGEYLVTAINHYVDGQGHYENDFTAVPASIKVPPVALLADPVCETQSAVVTDNNDFNGLGRVRVKFHWMNGAEQTPWIRVVAPHSGGGKGHFFMPEIGEEVVVGFESDSATRPYIIGTVYHGTANNSFSNAGNDIKTIQTRSGTKIRMNDAEGSVLVEDPSGNIWFMDGKGNINVNAPETMTFTCKNMNINVQENIHTNVGQDHVQTVGMNNTLSVGANHNTSVGLINSLTVGGDSLHRITGTFTELIEGDIISESKQERREISEKGIELSSNGSIAKHAQKEIHNNSFGNTKTS